MILLIGVAITVAFLPSWGASPGVLDQELTSGGSRRVPAPIGLVIPMSLGAILMSVSTVVVAFNAQLLRRLDLRPSPSSRTRMTSPTNERHRHGGRRHP